MIVRQSDVFDCILKVLSRSGNKFDSMVENSADNKLRYAILWVLAVLACFGAIFLLNILTPLISDDFAYLFVYGESAHITSVSDIVQSQVNHYYMWGGRSVVHFVAQVLLMLPGYVADLLNTFVYLIYVTLIYWHIKGRGVLRISLFILINFAVWFLQPVFGDTVLWITGSANYLWGTTFILLFLLPYRLYEGEEIGRSRQVLTSAGLFLFGIVAGWTNENTAGGMILIALLFCYYYRTQTWKIPIWSIAGLLGGLIGFLVMILAPGNFERAGDTSGLTLCLLGYRLFNSTLTFFFYGGSAILSSVVMLILYRRFAAQGRNSYVLKISLIYIIAAIAAVYAMLLSPTFPRRALFGVVSFLIVGMGILFYNLDFGNKFLRQIRLTLILVGMVCFLFTFYIGTKEINTYRLMVQEREVAIENAKKEGLDCCEFDRYIGGNYIHGEDPFSEELMTRYYGITIKLNTPKD